MQSSEPGPYDPPEMHQGLGPRLWASLGCTPAAIDPDGRLSLAGLRNDLVFFKEQKLIEDPKMTVERIIDTSFAQKAAQELGPYKPRG